MNITDQNRLAASGVDLTVRVDTTTCKHEQMLAACVICNGHDKRDREKRAANSRAAFLRFKYAMKNQRDRDELLARQFVSRTRTTNDNRLYTR